MCFFPVVPLYQRISIQKLLKRVETPIGAPCPSLRVSTKQITEDQLQRNELSARVGFLLTDLVDGFCFLKMTELRRRRKAQNRGISCRIGINVWIVTHEFSLRGRTNDGNTLELVDNEFLETPHSSVR